MPQQSLSPTTTEVLPNNNNNNNNDGGGDDAFDEVWELRETMVHCALDAALDKLELQFPNCKRFPLDAVKSTLEELHAAGFYEANMYVLYQHQKIRRKTTTTTTTTAGQKGAKDNNYNNNSVQTNSKEKLSDENDGRKAPTNELLRLDPRATHPESQGGDVMVREFSVPETAILRDSSPQRQNRRVEHSNNNNSSNNSNREYRSSMDALTRSKQQQQPTQPLASPRNYMQETVPTNKGTSFLDRMSNNPNGQQVVPHQPFPVQQAPSFAVFHFTSPPTAFIRKTAAEAHPGPHATPLTAAQQERDVRNQSRQVQEDKMPRSLVGKKRKCDETPDTSFEKRGRYDQGSATYPLDLTTDWHATTLTMNSGSKSSASSKSDVDDDLEDDDRMESFEDAVERALHYLEIDFVNNDNVLLSESLVERVQMEMEKSGYRRDTARLRTHLRTIRSKALEVRFQAKKGSEAKGSAKVSYDKTSEDFEPRCHNNYDGTAPVLARKSDACDQELFNDVGKLEPFEKAVEKVLRCLHIDLTDYAESRRPPESVVALIQFEMEKRGYARDQGRLLEHLKVLRLKAVETTPFDPTTRWRKTESLASSASDTTIVPCEAKSSGDVDNQDLVLPSCINYTRCFPLPNPVPNDARAIRNKAQKSKKLPPFPCLANFPDYVTNKGTRKGRRMVNCTMCGLLRPSSYAGIGGAGKGEPCIPTQNKNVCTVCDTTVWEVVFKEGIDERTGRPMNGGVAGAGAGGTSNNNGEIRIPIKWCKGCKNFLPWEHFLPKLFGTKCVSCRDRSRQLYAAKKEG